MSFTTSLEIINFVKSDVNICVWIAASVADAAAVNPNSIKTLLANGLSTFPIKGNPVFSNGPKSLPKNLPDCPIKVTSGPFFIADFNLFSYELDSFTFKVSYWVIFILKKK